MPRWERMKEAWKGVDDGGRLDTSPKKQKGVWERRESGSKMSRDDYEC